MLRAVQSRRERATKREQLTTGKIITRRFSRAGSVVEERHSYGDLDIGIRYFFKEGVKTDEMYFSKGRLLSRRVYERARGNYADMPPDNQKSEDWGALGKGCEIVLNPKSGFDWLPLTPLI